MSDEAQLIQLNMDIAQWEQQRDEGAIRKLDRYLAETLLFRRADRSVVDKASFMKALGGPSPFASRHSGKPAVTIKGERAVSIVTVFTVKTDGSRNAYRNIRQFSRQGDEWRLEFWFNDDISSLMEL
jgi:hypothetical protein